MTNKIHLVHSTWDISGILRSQRLTDQTYHITAGVTRSETFKKRKVALWVELAEFVNEWKSVFKYWSWKETDREKMLEEYVDALHFFMSLADDLYMLDSHSEIRYTDDPLDQIFLLSSAVVGITGAFSFKLAFSLFRGIGYLAGFNEKEIEDMYHKKNEKNKVREDHLFGYEPN